ncbi:ubiquitin carboxyl-terminal hydrolase [Hokovirus HKV1]|uniref:Ubiquitin carboxyl-terminal hydrolase n=1 Tax=Hokovirus HKV1 TaxID=1977638 RepID=A0A1V0SGJ6_9VIRU|nr:ubiquitin carboxyl-terminal hydrolase [Hokovirus HKV1]
MDFKDTLIEQVQKFKPKLAYGLIEKEEDAKNLMVIYSEFERETSYLIDTQEKIINNQLNDYIQKYREEFEQYLKIISEERQKYMTNGVCGLKNTGNTCFLNVILQCLNNEPSLNKFFCSNYFENALKRNIWENLMTNNPEMTDTGTIIINEETINEEYINKITYRLAELMKVMTSNNKVIIPTSLDKLIREKNVLFEARQQQDCQELLNFIIDSVHEEIKYKYDKVEHRINTFFSNKLDENHKLYELNKDLISYWGNYAKNNYSIITEYLSGIYTTYVVCCNCNKLKQKYEPFTTLQLSMPENEDQGYDIGELLKNYSAMESLSQDNQYFCDTCNQNQDAEKYSFISLCPRILIIQLKRFKYDIKTQNLVKIQTEINFPFNDLHLNDIIDHHCNVNYLNNNRGLKYNLCSIVKHVGSNLQSGHYVCYCKNTVNSMWYKYNDEYVSYIEPEQIIEETKQDSYILFYHLE